MRTMGREEEGEKEEKWKINAPRATRCTAEPCNAFNFPHKFICPSPLSHSFRISRAFFLPLSLSLRQDADKLSSRNTVSYPFNHPHFPFILFISWPSVWTHVSRIPQFVTLSIDLLLSFSPLFELTCDSSSCWKVIEKF